MTETHDAGMTELKEEDISDFLPEISDATLPELRAMMDPQFFTPASKGAVLSYLKFFHAQGWYRPVIEPLLHFLQQEYAENPRSDRYPYVLSEFLRRHLNPTTKQWNLSNQTCSRPEAGRSELSDDEKTKCVCQTLCLFLAFEARPLLDPHVHTQDAMRRLGEILLAEGKAEGGAEALGSVDQSALAEKVKAVLKAPAQRGDRRLRGVLDDEGFATEAARQLHSLHSSGPRFVSSDADEHRFTRASIHVAYHVLVHELLNLDPDLQVQPLTSLHSDGDAAGTTQIMLDEARFPNLVYCTVDSGTPVLGYSVMVVHPMDTVSTSVSELLDKTQSGDVPTMEPMVTGGAIDAVFDKVPIEANQLAWAQAAQSRRAEYDELDATVRKLRPHALAIIRTVTEIRIACSRMLKTDKAGLDYAEERVREINKNHLKINVVVVKGSLKLNKLNKARKNILSDEKLNDVLTRLRESKQLVAVVAQEFRRVFYKEKGIGMAESGGPAEIAKSFEEYVYVTASASKETNMEIDMGMFNPDESPAGILDWFRQQRTYKVIVDACDSILKAFTNVFAEKDFSSLYEAINFVTIKDAYSVLIINHLNGDLYLPPNPEGGEESRMLSRTLLRLANELVRITHHDYADLVVSLQEVASQVAQPADQQMRIFKLIKSMMTMAPLSEESHANITITLYKQELLHIIHGLKQANLLDKFPGLKRLAGQFMMLSSSTDSGAGSGAG